MPSYKRAAALEDFGARPDVMLEADADGGGWVAPTHEGGAARPEDLSASGAGARGSAAAEPPQPSAAPHGAGGGAGAGSRAEAGGAGAAGAHGAAGGGSNSGGGGGGTGDGDDDDDIPDIDDLELEEAEEEDEARPARGWLLSSRRGCTYRAAALQLLPSAARLAYACLRGGGRAAPAASQPAQHGPGAGRQRPDCAAVHAVAVLRSACPAHARAAQSRAVPAS